MKTGNSVPSQKILEIDKQNEKQGCEKQGLAKRFSRMPVPAFRTITLTAIHAAIFFACLAVFPQSASAAAPPNNPAPSGDILLFHAVSAGIGDPYAYFKISELPYTIKEGDVLEFDIQIWAYSAEPKGGIDVVFTDNSHLQGAGATDQFGLSFDGGTSINIATGKWMHRTFALDKLAGKTTAQWFINERGAKTGDYFVALDNITVTNGGKIQAEIYKDGEPPMSVQDRRVGYTLCKLKTVKSADLDAELAKSLTADMLLGAQDAGEWISGRPDEAKYRELVKQAKTELDIESCRASQQEKCSASMRQALDTLAPLSKLIKSYELDYVGHGHIDMNWLWLWPETVQVGHDTFTSVLKLMNDFPDFKYSQSQASIYVAIQEKYPELFKQIKKRVAEGRWELTGGSWVEGDLNMASGESIVRSIMYSKRYFKKEFGKEVEILWEPDTFGHAWTIPQIMKKSGLKYYFFVRCGKGKPLFWWEGPDGSRVLALNAHSYGDSIQSKNANFLNEIENAEGLKIGATVYGVGDHGGGPTRADLEKGTQLNKEPLYPSMRFSFFKDFMDRVMPYSDKLPVIRDELNFTFRGCYTTHADIKKANRKSESIMNISETASAIAADHGRPYNTAGFEKAWRNIAFNQFHDIFDGSAIHGSYKYSHQLYDDAFKIADRETAGALAYLAKRIKVNKTIGIPVMVFNPLGWERDDPVEVTAVFPSWPAAITISDGKNEAPAQILYGKEVDNGISVRLLFMAKGVPPVGWKTFYLKSAEKRATSGVTAGRNFVENEFLKVEINPNNGIVTRIFDKANNRDVIPPYTEANLLQMLREAPVGMSAWDIGPIRGTTPLDSGRTEGRTIVESQFRGSVSIGGDPGPDISVMEKGPVRAVIRINRKESVYKSQFTQKIVLYASSRRIDFPCKVTWEEIGGSKNGSEMLKVVFPVAVKDGKATFEIPFGSIERPANGDEVPALKWIDLSNADYGVSLLNDSKYGHDVKDNALRLTLLRSSYDPDPLPDFGKHEFVYSLYPHKGGWKAAGTVRQGYDLNHPLAAVNVASTLPKADLPPVYSLLNVQPASLVVTAVKISEDNPNRLIVRFYDSEGAAGKGAITFNTKIRGLKETDLLEREIKSSRFKQNGNRFNFDFGNSEIITLSAELASKK